MHISTRFSIPVVGAVIASFVFLSVGCQTGQDTDGAKAASSKAEAAPAVPTAPEYPDNRPREKTRVDVKGIYVTSWVAGGDTRWAELVDFVDKSELNAMVIDVKDDGNLSYEIDHPVARNTKANLNRIPNIDAKLKTLAEKDIYPIARITCFRDNVVPKRQRALAIQRPDGSPWRDRAGHTWMNPYSKDVWDYLVAVAIDAAKRGFREVQFDYVRFPSEGNIDAMRFPGKDARKKVEVIADFLKYAKEKLEPYNVWVAADVFGLVTQVKRDMGIGQNMVKMAEHLDYLCPMVYPSHYNSGEYNLRDPNRSAYRVVFAAMKESKAALKEAGSECLIRPWLQDFSLYGVSYGPKQVRAQIQAARENGVDGYLMWNAANRYSSRAYYPPPVKKAAQTNGAPEGKR